MRPCTLLASGLFLVACAGTEPTPAPPSRAATLPSAGPSIPRAVGPAPPSIAPSTSTTPAPTPSDSAALRPRALDRDAKKAIVLAVVEAFNAHDAERVVAQYVAKPFARTPTASGMLTTRSRDVLARQLAALFAMIPDVRMDLVRVHISFGSVLTLEWILSGTDTKGLGGARPTGAKLGVRALTVWWLSPDNAPFVATDATYYDVATLFAQAGAGRAGVRPFATPPATPRFDWESPPQSDDGPTNDDVTGAFYDALRDNDDKGIAAKLADGAVWSDLTKRDDVSGKQNVLAALAAQAKVGRRLDSTGPSGGLAMESVWNVTRGGKKTAIHTAELVEIAGGAITRVTSFGNARE